jgi:threonine dehydrogenase-like Zn-dependent dehydrogenase
MKQLFGAPEILTINYSTTPQWDEKVLELTDGIGVDLVVENGGSSSLVKSLKCTRRGGIVSQVGYLGKQKSEDLQDLVSTIIDRRVILRSAMFHTSGVRNANVCVRGINAGPVSDMDDLCAALEATQMQLGDIIDTVYPFDKAEEAVQSLWNGKVVGKVVIRL